MVFHSPNFLFFFVALWAAYLVFRRARIGILAVGNVVFYGASGLGVLAVFVLVTLLTYAAVRLMGKPGWGWAFWAGLAINVGNLGFFKYTVFLLESVESVLRIPLAYEGTWVSEIVLPIGISFYTFQLISYLIDVRRGTAEPTGSFVRFWVYISLFPQLVAGPIMRGNELLPQLDGLERKRIRFDEMKFGVYLIVLGLVKKIVLADQIATFVNRLFAQGAADGTSGVGVTYGVEAVMSAGKAVVETGAAGLTGWESWLAAYAFGFQIYFDFSAYSDMALGLGYLLGIRLIINFRTPYLSGSPTEFWQRWHISLSRWIRDYIYIPLGGNRRGPVRVQANVLAAMLISGLWHGAMWTFVVWGAVHGALLILHRLWLQLSPWDWMEKLRQTRVWRVVTVFSFFHMVTWTWVFFRAESVGQALAMTRAMLMDTDWLALWTAPAMGWLAGLYALHVAEYWVREKEEAAGRVWGRVPFGVRGVVYLAVMLTIFYLQRGETYEFIYFQF